MAQLDTATLDYQTKSQELARLTEVVNTLEQQHTEYISRLYVAWATTPQMRNLVKVSSDMRQKLGMLRRNTIPTMKLLYRSTRNPAAINEIWSSSRRYF